MKRLFLSVLLPLMVFSACSDKQMTGVIITGQNNHNWPVSHVALKKTLENSGLFKMDVAVSPSAGEDMSAFTVDFSKYKLVVLDYNGDPWSDDMKAAFEEYVRNGGGVIVYHAADNAFTEWDEFNKMIALGGWGGRDEKSGPYVYWKDGALYKDYSPGFGGSHGARHEYVMNSRCNNHPVVEGLPARWKHATDELYDRMLAPATSRTCCIRHIPLKRKADPAARNRWSLQSIMARPGSSTSCWDMPGILSKIMLPCNARDSRPFC